MFEYTSNNDKFARFVYGTRVIIQKSFRAFFDIVNTQFSVLCKKLLSKFAV